jgi:hypothetical protein
MKKPIALLAVAAVSVVAAGCGSSSSSSSSTATSKTTSTAAAKPTKEVSPSGDIPDNQAYVPYAAPGTNATVKVPEGWSRSTTGGATVFTDKLNSIRIEQTKAPGAVTAAEVKRADVPVLAKSVSGFKLQSVATLQRKSGPVVRVSYLAKAQTNPVTGKGGTDAVERYFFAKGGKLFVLTLSGPKGADNVDPWKIITDSVTWR